MTKELATRALNLLDSYKAQEYREGREVMDELREYICQLPTATRITWNADGVRTVNGVPDCVEQPVPPASATSDAERLDFVCNKSPRYVEYSKNGMYRVYQDYAAPDEEYPLWVALTTKYYATGRIAIDAAIAAGGGQNG